MYFNKYRKDSKKKISNKKPKNHLNILFKQSQKKIIPHPISQIEKNNKEYNKDFNNLNKNTKPNSKNCEEKNINDNDLLLKYTLKILDLEKLFNNFNLNYISFYDLFLLTKDDLIEMNIPIGPRNRILHFSLEFKKFSKNFDLNELIKFFNIHKEFIFNETIFDENKNINKIKNEMGNIYFNNPIYNSSQISKNSFKNNNIINLRRTISINNNNSSNNNENNPKLDLNNINNNSFYSKQSTTISIQSNNSIINGYNNHKLNNVINNYENLVNQVEKFENQYLKMKEKSNALNNKIKNLLNKKQFDFKNFKNQLFDNNYLFEEKERNLNEELNKIYYQKY
jgi:hypothetical protein